MNSGENIEELPESEIEKRKLLRSSSFPFLFALILWLVRLIEIAIDERLFWLGIYPKHLKGIAGIFTSPFVHADWTHLMSNTAPILILGTTLFYFYKKVAFRSFLLIYFITGIWVWVGGRESWHIGASGIIYGLASFLFFSGIFRNSIELMAISLVVVFLYGGMVWGLFPIVENISWESHLSGGIAGLLVAVFYRNTGPQRKRYDWEHEEDEEDEEEKNDGFTNQDDTGDSGFLPFIQ
jgi:membrane associated rhomboid family serine protease